MSNQTFPLHISEQDGASNSCAHIHTYTHTMLFPHPRDETLKMMSEVIMVASTPIIRPTFLAWVALGGWA